MWDAQLGVPETKVPIGLATFASYVLPVLLLYFVMAILAITPHTRFLRLASWPILLLLALRATLSVDMALVNSKQKFRNDLANPMIMLLTRSLHWALAKEPLVRELRPANGAPSTLMDALDLATTLRGHGWDWSRGLYVPRETRPSNRAGFVLYAALSAVVHGFVSGTLHRAIRSFHPVGLGFISGGSIFDDALPPHLRYLRSSIIAILGGLAVYSFLQMSYDVSTVLAVVVLGHDPAQWPPGFDSPWRSTSLHEFWSRRWHQWLRHLFLVQGGYPLSVLFGRVGLITGAFLSSALYHHSGLWSVDTTCRLWRMVVGFGMMAPGMFAERAFKWSTGRKVSGLAGWVWTMSWLVLWGNLIIDGFVRAGLLTAHAAVPIDNIWSWRALVERLIRDFDTWLHAI